MKNTEKSYEFSEILANPSMYAKKFSEGNESLEQLLIYCFENGLVTKGCCIGHKDESIKPYISFISNETQLKVYCGMISNLLENDLSNNIHFTIHPVLNNSLNFLISVHLDKTENTNSFFKLIENGLVTEKHYSKYLNLFLIQKILYDNDIDINNSSFSISSNSIIYQFSGKVYVKELNLYTYGNYNIVDGKKIVDYINSLNSLNEFNMEQITSSYLFNNSNIETLFNSILKFCQVKQVKKNK